ncbi:ABC transporter permease [Paludibacterium yongneupense]|uniref:ABC transporter permease n=1 Tax=Paludibacterium yongneupense TaxID=400061 RepID=UPI00041E9F89|nr:ABC transporter permease [Paludibacterium yongneupense]
MRADLYHRLVVAALVALLAVPVLATLAYSLAGNWGATILPDSFSVRWYLQLWHDPRFLSAFGHSLLISVATLLLSTLVIVPAVFVVFYRFPALDRTMNLLILLPFAVPPVVSSVGLLQLYADGPLPLVGTPWILIGCYFTIALPFMYRTLADSLRGMNLHDLMDAAHLLGASTPRAFLLVVAPNLRTGLMASLFLSFSFLLGEFVFANILVGTRYETLQVYLYSVRMTSGHFTSAIVMSYFVFTLVLTWFATRLGKQESQA